METKAPKQKVRAFLEEVDELVKRVQKPPKYNHYTFARSDTPAENRVARCGTPVLYLEGEAGFKPERPMCPECVRISRTRNS